MKKIIIAIDGPSGSGKGTTAKGIAERLGYIHLDTGALYRLFTLFMIRHNVDSHDLQKIIHHISDVKIQVAQGEDDKLVYKLNNQEITTEIRTEEISRAVPQFAKIPEVRECIRNVQRQVAKSGGFVIEGRDIGTEVFPNAQLKVFLTADLEARSKRRYEELIRKGESVSLAEVMANLKIRDWEDENRPEHPLRRAADARVLDTTNITIEEQVQKVVEWHNEITNQQ